MKSNPLSTFDSFITSEANETTCKILKSLHNSTAVKYNPIFLYSEIGLGKTHLMNAVARASKYETIVHTTLEMFLNDFIKHVRAKKMNEFHDKYRTCDLLIIEEMQFIQNKEGIQEELLYTIQSLISDNKQVLFTSSKEIELFENIDEHLKNYICGGLMLDILPYDIETKKKITKLKAKEMNIEINDDDTQSIAKKYNNIRAIDGALQNFNVHDTTYTLSKLRKHERRESLL